MHSTLAILTAVYIADDSGDLVINLRATQSLLYTCRVLIKKLVRPAMTIARLQCGPLELHYADVLDELRWTEDLSTRKMAQ